MKNGTYEIFDRCYWLINKNIFTSKEYFEKFERSRRVLFRDLEHIKDFYNIEFTYNRIKKTWEKSGVL